MGWWLRLLRYRVYSTGRPSVRVVRVRKTFGTGRVHEGLVKLAYTTSGVVRFMLWPNDLDSHLTAPSARRHGPALRFVVEPATKGIRQKRLSHVIAHLLRSWNEAYRCLERLGTWILSHQIGLVHRIVIRVNNNWLIADPRSGLGKQSRSDLSAGGTERTPEYFAAFWS